MFIGFFLLMKLSNKYGRRTLTLVAGSINLFSSMLITFYPASLELLYLYFLLIGFGFSLGMTVTSNYILELIPQSNKIQISTIFHCFRSIPPLFCPFIILYVVKDMKYYEYACILMIAVGLAGTYYMPESPKYLHMKKRHPECEDAFNAIARANGVQNFNLELSNRPRV